ncbi:MAG: 4-hydroxybenzoate octaprenyltransferase [Alphaproteobacteria bacterium]|jgi:4-hydroxybenzoate polyprenyltransferase|nr:4-hydroxybenzoate octaprenyltransferase [Alphaproteobacteria bacterium]
MTGTTAHPSDMPADSWVDRHAPAGWRPYLKLMRLDRPIGTWLLLFPCWWSLALAPRPAGYGWHDLSLAVLFGLGAVIMRGAGCTINDLWDRDIDARVARTRGRPLASGVITVRRALAFLAVLLLAGLAVLLQFNGITIAVGALALLLVVPYPLMKRITYWPQLFLGLTFNWGALVGWTAATGGLGWPALVLYAGGVFWTLGYDTIYAHQDKADDVAAGVKSTALRLGAASRAWVAGFYVLCLAGLAAAGLSAGLAAWAFLPLLALAGGQLVWQVAGWRLDDPSDCLARFKSNKWFGALALLAFVVGGVAAG